MATVTANNTRLEDGESVNGWVSIGGGQGGSSEGSFAYQGSNLFNRKVTSSSGGGLAYDPTVDGGFSQDMTTASLSTVLIKCIVSDYGGLQTTNGVTVRLGSGSNAYRDFVVAGTDATITAYSNYPKRGGLVIAAVNPNLSAYQTGSSGNIALTGIDYFGVLAAFISSTAKSENVGMDAIDLGTGLTITGSAAEFQAFLAFDEGTKNNRFGYVTEALGILSVIGTLTLGDSTGSLSTQFSDSTSKLLLVDGYFDVGYSGIKINNQNASDTYDIACSIESLGTTTVIDTRGTFLLSGTSGTFTFSGTLRNFASVTLNSSATLNNSAYIDTVSLTQGDADITDTTIATASLSGVGCVTDFNGANFDSSTFTQVGAGHAISTTSTTSISLDNVKFSGYGGTGGSNAVANSGELDAAIYNNSGGLLTINILNGGDTPSIRNGAGATTVVNNTVGVYVDVTDESDSSKVQNARVLLLAASGGALPVGTVIISGLTDVDGKINVTDFAYLGDQPITGRIRKASGSPYFKTTNVVGTIGASGLTISALLLRDGA